MMQPLNKKELSVFEELLGRGFYSMVFQPIVSTITGKVFGFEALLRGPKGTPFASPGRIFHKHSILPEALLCKVDLACIGSAVRTGRLFPDDYYLFVNLHGLTLRSLAFDFGPFLQLLDEVGIAPEQIVFEISELTESHHIHAIVEHVQQIQRYGMQFAIDDIDFAHPWLDDIPGLAPAFLKLDRSVIQEVQEHEDRKNFVKDICQLAADSGAEVIAEGIEQVQEYKAMRELNVSFCQGFLLGKPCSAKHWLTVMETQDCRLVGVSGLF